MAGKHRDASKAQQGQSSEKAKAVANLLAEGKAKDKDKRVGAVVFFQDSVAAADVEKRIGQLIAEAGETLPSGSEPVKIRQVSKLAKSVALVADHNVIEEICRSADVKTVLPTEVEDIHPKPVGGSGSRPQQRRQRGRKSGR